MTETSQSHLEGLGKNTDHGMRLLLARPGESQAYGSVKQVFDFNVAWNRHEPSRLQFKTYKDAPGAADLQSNPDVQLIVELWEPWKREWIQPVNSRFVLEAPKHDLADETNEISYSAVQFVKRLDKVVLYRRTTDQSLNNALDAAEDAFGDAESDFNSAWNTFDGDASAIRQRHGMWGGQNFAQKGFPASTRSRKIPKGSILVSGWIADKRWQGQLYYFNGTKWKRLSRTKWKDDKVELVKAGLDVLRKRRVMIKRKEELRKATWAARESSRGGRRYFHNRSAGYILHRAMTEGQRRDVLRGFAGNSNSTRVKGVMRSFTNGKDSRKKNWTAATRASMEFQIGQGVFSMLTDLQERGLCDWQTRNTTLDLVPKGALRVNQSNRVAIRLGKDVSEGVTNASYEDHASVVLVVGDGGKAYEHRMGLDASVKTGIGYWEGSISESAAVSQTPAGRLTQDLRAQMAKRMKLETSRKVVVGQNSALPMVDYQPHHLISVYESTGNRASRVVEQIILSQPDAGEPLEAVITFESRFQSTPVQFRKSLSKTMGGIDHMQGRIPLDQTPRIPAEVEAQLRPSNLAPPISEISGAIRFNDEGQPNVLLRVKWAAGYEAELPPIPEEQYAELIEETETEPVDDGFIEEEE